ncbi:MAG: hypothetical protein V2A71_07530 [Candidatus Eisenbacteria bacterium]
MKRVYGLSERQLEAAKRELRKKEPSLATKATQSPPGYRMPAATR